MLKEVKRDKGQRNKGTRDKGRDKNQGITENRMSKGVTMECLEGMCRFKEKTKQEDRMLGSRTGTDYREWLGLRSQAPMWQKEIRETRM